MKLTNHEIYEHATNLAAFKIEGKLPIKINFFLQKNIQTLTAAAQEIESARMEIARSFGKLNEEGDQYVIPQESIGTVNKELDDLFFLEQDLPIHTFKLDDFDGIEVTYDQMTAIMFMID